MVRILLLARVSYFPLASAILTIGITGSVPSIPRQPHPFNKMENLAIAKGYTRAPGNRHRTLAKLGAPPQSLSTGSGQSLSCPHATPRHRNPAPPSPPGGAPVPGLSPHPAHHVAAATARHRPAAQPVTPPAVAVFGQPRPTGKEGSRRGAHHCFVAHVSAARCRVFGCVQRTEAHLPWC